MKRAANIHFQILFGLVCMGAFDASPSRAQGTLQVSNLGQTPTGSALVANNAWIAQAFGISTADPTKYALDSIQLLMNTGTGSPSGFNVSVYTSVGNVPGTDLGALTGPDPAAGGLFTYSASGITLSGGAYFLVVTGATPVAQGDYVWSAAKTLTQNGNWVIDDAYATSANGSSWTTVIRQDIFQMAIYTTPTPEPATFGIVAAGLAVLGIWRRRFSRK